MTREADFGYEFLDAVIEWIAVKYDPEDIFSEYALADWAKQQVASDVLSEKQLVVWAKDWASKQDAEDVLSVEQLVHWTVAHIP